ncbi:squamous cell carcinoma antigen recognized by T-cells 3 isoform X2 [Durio zibethinus]|uniref:Squamous cell carcinoma antigen recognized by T-cells 3 isoform X2 n=1 Tax=Durio zibethinus TaxID=66656 RepID=A0A6P5X6I5_DURZI|nr:squamous cell carcinoma antigen recognized by T-cells 3 isoform X2 [Durio zibethinus]
MEQVEKSPISKREDTEMGESDVDENPKSIGKSSSDSESSDSEDEAEQNGQLLTLESELSTNPSNYDAHVQYIKLLRRRGEIEKLREARENMNALFPLSPSMWVEWAKDEASLSNDSDSEAVEKLYERGISEYLSIPLWSEYLNYVQEHDPQVRECSADGISKARNLFERAVTAAALHIAQGSQIWDAYTQFEQAILLTIDQSDIQVKEKQVQRIRSIFHRCLSIPFANLKSTLLAYKAWEVEQGNALCAESDDVDGIEPHVASAYQKAEKMYNARAHLEEQITREDISESERFQNYMSYLEFEKSFGDPARVQILYERAITDFPVSSDLWLDYTRYLDKTLKAGNAVKDVYSRAARNCPWVGELWVRYLLCLESGHASEKEISAVFEKSLQCTFSTLEEYHDLFLTRVDGLRRRMSLAKGDDVLNYSLIRECFQQAADYLSPHMKNNDGLLRLYAYWARLELKLGNDLIAARGVWESLLKTCGSMLEAWKGYIAMEIELGHINEVRAIYKRCYSKRFSGTGSEDICQAWLRFEREFGTLEDLNYAVEKVTPRLEELQLFRLQQESKSFSEATYQREQNLKKTVREKRKSGLSTIDEQSPAKRQKNTSQSPKNLHEEKDTQRQNLAEANVRKEQKGKVEKQVNELLMKDTNPSKTRLYTDQCTAFLSNLSFKAKDEDLHRFFSDVGGVTSIRILYNKFTGQSRGLAYVDFEDDEHLAAAVAKNKQMLLGKSLSIARSNPKQGRKGSIALTAPDGHDFNDLECTNRLSIMLSKLVEDASNRSGIDESSESKESVEISKGSAHKRVENIQLKGKNTFAVPRNVRPLGWTTNKPRTTEEGDDKPKSNDEFRKMFMKT